MGKLTEATWRKLFKELANGAKMSEVARSYNVGRSSIYYKQRTMKGLPNTRLSNPAPSEPLPDPDLSDKTTAQLKEEAAELHKQLERDATLEEAAASALPVDDDAKLREVQRRHKAEPNAIRERLYRALKDHKAATSIAQKRIAFEDMKAAKIASEVMLNLHKMERQAWGFDFTEAPDGAGGGGIHLHVQYVERPYDNEKVIEGETT